MYKWHLPFIVFFFFVTKLGQGVIVLNAIIFSEQLVKIISELKNSSKLLHALQILIEQKIGRLI